MKESGFTDVRTSINRRHNTVAQYIATRPLLDLCEGGNAARRGEGNNPQQGGSNKTSVGEFLQGGGPAGATVWGKDVGGVAKNGAGARSFLHGAASQSPGRQPRRGWDGKWFYPSLVGAMKEAGFTDVRTSINRR